MKAKETKGTKRCETQRDEKQQKWQQKNKDLAQSAQVKRQT
jgi:hypothetical protein